MTETNVNDVIGPGRVAVVTGAASGIGRALAEAFGAEVWKLSVWNVPHTMALTRMPRGPYSSADARVSALSPALAAA